MISVVGPLTSIVLGAIFLALGGTLAGRPRLALGNPAATLSGLGPGATILLWLGSINVTLGVFNLVPGFPLDGGRILRSILWTTMRDLRRATRTASQVGQSVGWIFVFLGLAMVLGVRVPVFGTGVGSGLWIALIGWFLRNAAGASYQQLLIEDLLEDIPVGKLMRSDVQTVSPGLSVSELVHEFMLGSDERAFPVIENGGLAGLVTIEDVRKAPRDSWPATPVREIMTPLAKLAVLEPRQDASQALHELTRRDVRQLPVVENGRLVGLLRRRDILRWLQLQSDVAIPGV